jgi:soluble lytic murein transglycosylase-like protein
MISWSGITAALLTAMVFILSGAQAHADIYRYQDENGVWHFTNINSDTRYQMYIRVRDKDPSVFIKKYDSIIEQASDTFGIDSSLIKAVIKAESGFDHKATSSKGAQGLMQLMPKTATDMEVRDPYEPEQNIFGGARYLSDLLGRYNNNMERALAAYNAGPENVEAYKGVPPFPETETFIKRVLDYYDTYKKTGTD